MTEICCSCYVCGPQVVPPSQVRLFIHEDLPDLDVYVFRCPSCHDEVAKHADEDAILLLTPVVETVLISRPAEVDERVSHMPPLTEDDLLDFLLHLSADDLAGIARSEELPSC